MGGSQKGNSAARTMVTAMPEGPSIRAGVLQPCHLLEYLSLSLYLCLPGLRLKTSSGIVRVGKLELVLIPLLAIGVIQESPLWLFRLLSWESGQDFYQKTYMGHFPTPEQYFESLTTKMLQMSVCGHACTCVCMCGGVHVGVLFPIITVWFIKK